MKTAVTPDISKDQYFLKDVKILEKIADLANIKKSDVVLEIGAGPGNLTQILANKAGRVIAVEIDEKFRGDLEKLPRNVEVHFADAHDFVSQGGKFWKKKPYNKIVANIPYNLAEWLLHNIAFVYLDKIILLVPKSFAYKIEKGAVFGSFFKVKMHFEVDKKEFYPIPNTNSVVIELRHLPDAIKTKNSGLFLRQFMYQQEDWKVKNSLREGLIEYHRLTFNKKLTKNEARKIIADADIPDKLLDSTPNNKEIYELAGKIKVQAA